MYFFPTAFVDFGPIEYRNENLTNEIFYGKNKSNGLFPIHIGGGQLSNGVGCLVIKLPKTAKNLL